MTGENSVRVRAHHLATLLLNRELSLRETQEKFLKTKYTDRLEHPFAQAVYDFTQSLWANPKQLVVPVSGEEDKICQNCPAEITCPRCHPENSVYVQKGDEEGWKRGQDNTAMIRLGVEEGQAYSFEELMEREWTRKLVSIRDSAGVR